MGAPLVEQSPVDRYIRYNAKTKFFEPTWWRRDVLPFWLFPDEQYYSTGYITINASPNDTPPVVYKLPHASLEMDRGLGNPLRITDFVFEDSTDLTATAAWTVFLKDMGDQLNYMNAPIHVRTFAGTSQLPGHCFEPLLLPSRHALMMTPDKLAGAAATVRLYMVGELYCSWSPNLERYPIDRQIMEAVINKHLERRKYIQPFWLTTDDGGVLLPASQTVEVDATIGDDGHFEGSHIMGISTDDYEVTIFNPLTRQTIVNGAIHSDMIGDARNPQPFPATFVVPAGETIRFRIKNLTADLNKVYLTVRGRKIRAPLRDIEQVKRDMAVNEPKIAAQVAQKAGA